MASTFPGMTLILILGHLYADHGAQTYDDGITLHYSINSITACRAKVSCGSRLENII